MATAKKTVKKTPSYRCPRCELKYLKFYDRTGCYIGRDKWNDSVWASTYVCVHCGFTVLMNPKQDVYYGEDD